MIIKMFSKLNQTFYINTFAVLLLMFSSCTKDITVDLPNPEDKIVVEGSIDVGVPPFVILTKNSSFFGGINFNDLSAYFVRDADKVWVYNDAGDTTRLQQFCLSDPRVARAFGYDFQTDSIPEICVYTIPDILTWFTTGSASFVGHENTTYHLYIEAEGKKLSSTTLIPYLYPFDSLNYKPHPNPSYDSLVQVSLFLTFPSVEGRYVRLLTKRNSEGYYTPANGSVFEYKIFLGQSTGLPLSRGQAPGSEFDRNTFGYFWKGDTVSVKWSQIDKGVYDFYTTLEADGGDSPFSSPVKIISNVNGGLGVWAGYATTYGSLIVPK